MIKIYKKHYWMIYGDLNVISMLLGQQLDNTNISFVNGSQAKGKHFKVINRTKRVKL